MIYSAVMECYNLWERGDNLSKQLSWLSSVFYLFRIAGYRYSSISRYFELEEVWLQKVCGLNFKSYTVSTSSKPYLYLGNWQLFIAIIRFRISLHNLPLEKGRWEGINKTECKCKKCISNDVGDEKYCILYCNASDTVKLRAMFFKDNKLARIPSECASSFIESILATSKGTPQLTGKFLNGIIEFLKDK